MRLSVILTGLFLSGAALACPNLAGKYLCSVEGEVSKLEVTQAVVDGVTVFTVTEDDGKSVDVSEIVADNKRYETDDGNTHAWIQSSCQGEQLVVDFYAKDRPTDTEVSGAIKMSNDQALDLVQNASGYIVVDGTRHEFNDTSTCKRDALAGTLPLAAAN